MQKILLIEDNLDVRENIMEILQLANYEVLAAENGKIGVQMAIASVPDLIICDIMMPEMDGYEVLHMIRRNQTTVAVPFIFLTAKAEWIDLRKGMDMGADDYITKPFENIDLLNAIETRLQKAKHSMSNTYPDTFLKTNKDIMDLFGDDHEVLELKKRQIIYSANKMPFYLFYVLSGNAKTYRINDDGKEFITGIYKKGDFLGYAPLFENTVYPDSAEALEDTKLMIVPKATFQEMINTNVSLAGKFLQITTHNLVNKEDKLVSIAYNSLRKRVADSLINVYDCFKGDGEDKPALGISREDLAKIAGTVKESLTRTLSDFKEEGLIEIRKGKIVILEEKKLKHMAN